MTGRVVALENPLAPRRAGEAAGLGRCSSAAEWVSLLYLPVDIVGPCVLGAFESPITDRAIQPVPDDVDGPFSPHVPPHVSGGSRLLSTHCGGKFATSHGNAFNLPHLAQYVRLSDDSLHTDLLSEWLWGRILSFRCFDCWWVWVRLEVFGVFRVAGGCPVLPDRWVGKCGMKIPNLSYVPVCVVPKRRRRGN